MTHILLCLFAPVLYLAAHEGGHYIAGLLMDGSPSFKREGFRFFVSHKLKTWNQKRIFSVAGFGGGMLTGLALTAALILQLAARLPGLFVLAYWFALSAHFCAYSWTNQTWTSDFLFLIPEKYGRY